MARQVSKTARVWAELVYEHRPISIAFTRVPPECQRSGCDGYHETYIVTVHKDGTIEFVRRHDHHTATVDSRPLQFGRGIVSLAELAYQLMRWVRKVDPHPVYPKQGFRITRDAQGREIVESIEFEIRCLLRRRRSAAHRHLFRPEGRSE